jgi:hypothetical protein
MALQVVCSLDENAGCRSIDFIEETGNYNASTNPGGFGAPNAAINDITQVLINVYPEGYTTPILLDLAITTGTVTGLDITLPGGTATAFSLSGLNTTYPWTAALPFVISGEMLTGVEDSELTYGAYNIDYIAYAGVSIASQTNLEALIVCQVERAVKNAQGALDVDCKCDCSSPSYMSAFQSRVYLDSAKHSMENAEPLKAAETLRYAYELATGNCKTC